MTREKLMGLVAKYHLEELLSDEITKDQIGWYVVANSPIDELEALVDFRDLEDMGFYVDRQYWGGGQCYYRVFAPKSWL